MDSISWCQGENKEADASLMLVRPWAHHQCLHQYSCDLRYHVSYPEATGHSKRNSIFARSELISEVQDGPRRYLNQEGPSVEGAMRVAIMAIDATGCIAGNSE